MTEEQMNAAVTEIKAESFDQITALNKQLQNVNGQLNQQNLLLQEIVKIVADGKTDLTVEALLDRLRGAFNMTTGEGTDD